MKHGVRSSMVTDPELLPALPQPARGPSFLRSTYSSIS